MEHLTLEKLARLVDHAPSDEEARHLERCGACRTELEALRDQTEGLGHLPELRPPPHGWERLAARLREEGLVRAAPAGAEGRGGRTSPRVPSRGPLRSGSSRRAGLPGWMQAAAGIVLLVTGTGLGLGLSSLAPGTGDAAGGARGAAGGELPVAMMAALEDPDAGPGLTLQEAEELVRVTEEWYRTALVHYRERLAAEGGDSPAGTNPVTRFATLEALLAASRAAVREAPTDPFLNGLLVNMRAERDATLRGIQAASGENWF